MNFFLQIGIISVKPQHVMVQGGLNQVVATQIRLALLVYIWWIVFSSFIRSLFALAGETLTEEALSFILLSIFHAHETPVSGGEGRALNSRAEGVRYDRKLYASFSNSVGRSPEPQLEQRLAHTR
jgi:hypothetical protein